MVTNAQHRSKMLVRSACGTDLTLEACLSTIRLLLGEAGITHLVWDHPVSNPTHESSPAVQPLIDRLGQLYPDRPDIVDPLSPPSDDRSSG